MTLIIGSSENDNGSAMKKAQFEWLVAKKVAAIKLCEISLTTERMEVQWC